MILYNVIKGITIDNPQDTDVTSLNFPYPKL